MALNISRYASFENIYYIYTFTSSVIRNVFAEYYLNCFSVKERAEGMVRGMIWKNTLKKGERKAY